MKKTLIAACSIFLISAHTAGAGPGTCEEVVAVGHTFASGPTTFDGAATTNLGDAIVHVDLLGVKPQKNGRLNAATAHTLTIGSLVFTTRDNATLTPLNDLGLFRLNTQANIDSDDAWGHLSIDGLVELSPTGWAKWLATGQVCSR